MMKEKKFRVWVEDVPLTSWEQNIIKASGLALSPRGAEGDYGLVKEKGRWTLWPLKYHPFKPFKVQFTDTKTLRSLRSFGSANPLAKAMGRSAGAGTRVLDASAGWLQDALFLAKWGLQVTAFERNPVVYLLVRSALEAARQEREFLDLVGEDRLDYIYGDAQEVEGSWEVVYFDPMFPPKKALAEKPLQILKDLVGSDGDSEKVFEELRQKATARSVLKRSPQSPRMGAPDYSLNSKSVRFDIYLS